MRRLGMLAAVLTLVAPLAADAFCGFYVSGGDAKLFNNATMVVLMRDGTRTVLSMQNNYQGPPEAFAMVVPVPVVLQQENVKTLEREVFDRVDSLAAPRLVEYWEQDPCEPELAYPMTAVAEMSSGADEDGTPDRGLGVKVEAEFVVGEYQVVVLSASDAAGLDTWLRQEHYNIPPGAEPLFRPYIAEGWKFFVAKVDPAKVRFEKGQAMLSPLRFHYDAEDFRLPIRLGLINSAGTQDLIVHILARHQRYEVANYPNVTIPTNIEVADGVRKDFGAFYAALFDRTLAKHPGAVVTEYAWVAESCDPCPVDPLTPEDLVTLGADVLPALDMGELSPYGNPFVLTRLHARYGKTLGEDLVFKAAPPIAGGREHLVDGKKLEEGARPDSTNNFQGRYAIRHRWQGHAPCASPRWGRWGGPPDGNEPAPVAAKDLAFAPRGGVSLAAMVRQDVPELDLQADRRNPPPGSRACGCVVGGAPGGLGTGGLLLVALGLVIARRRR
jgi:MYXO-CTERM domain-containing protein